VPAPTLLARVNAGALEGDHWLHDPELGGGRLLGEGCHFVDLLSYLTGSTVAVAHAAASPMHDRAIESSDRLVATLRFGNGSVGSLVYSGAGDTKLAKERIEAFGGGMSAVLDDFRRLEIYTGGKSTVTKGAQDKGHAAEVERFVALASGREAPTDLHWGVDSTRATLALAESLRTGLPVDAGVSSGSPNGDSPA
jgi:polar amino acid transport system substrate-binding protein